MSTLHPGVQDRLISEVTTGAGTTAREGAVFTDSILCSVYVNSIPSGTLTVNVYTLTNTGKSKLIISFPVISSGTTELLLKKAAVTLQRYQVVASYTGVCDYEVYVRATSGAGAANAAIIGAPTFITSQVNVPVAPAVTTLIPVSLTDRNGVVIKNWSTSGNLWISEDSAKLTAQAWAIGPKDALAMDVASGVVIYAQSDLGTIDCRIIQAGGAS